MLKRLPVTFFLFLAAVSYAAAADYGIMSVDRNKVRERGAIV